jgi:hypothetical protein
VTANPYKEDDTIAWEGNDHKISDPGMTVAVHKANDRLLHVTVKRQGKVVDTVRVALSKNGNTLTAIEKGVDSKGRALDNVEVYEKQ